MITDHSTNENIEIKLESEIVRNVCNVKLVFNPLEYNPIYSLVIESDLTILDDSEKIYDDLKYKQITLTGECVYNKIDDLAKSYGGKLHAVVMNNEVKLLLVKSEIIRSYVMVHD